MFYNSVVSLINKRTILIYIPRLVSILFIILQFLGMLVYPGGQFMILKQVDIHSLQISFQIWEHMQQGMVNQTIYP